MPRDGTIDQLRSSIPALLTYVSNQLSITGSISYMQCAGVGIMEFRVLTTLAAAPRLRASAIVQSIGLDKSAVSRTLKSLQENGLVVATVKPGARRPDYSLSTEGQRIHASASVIAARRRALLLKGMSEADRQRLIALLRVMHDNIPLLKSLTDEVKANTTRAGTKSKRAKRPALERPPPKRAKGTDGPGPRVAARRNGRPRPLASADTAG
jgi:DNA-binding MarR family transcriptional regulator